MAQIPKGVVTESVIARLSLSNRLNNGIQRSEGSTAAHTHRHLKTSTNRSLLSSKDFAYLCQCFCFFVFFSFFFSRIPVDFKLICIMAFLFNIIKPHINVDLVSNQRQPMVPS